MFLFHNTIMATSRKIKNYYNNIFYEKLFREKLTRVEILGYSAKAELKSA